MIDVSVSLLYGVRSLYATMPSRLFDALESAHLAGEEVCSVYAEDVLATFAV